MKRLQDMADGLRMSVLELLERQWGEPLPTGALILIAVMASITEEAFELAPIIWRQWPPNKWGKS